MNVYNSEKSGVTEELQHYIKQLGNNFHIIGDFNAHTKLLDTKCVKENVTGCAIENIVINCNICLINSLNFYTYMNNATDKRSYF